MRTIRRLTGIALVLGTLVLPALGSAADKGAETEQRGERREGDNEHQQRPATDDFRIVTVSTRPDTVTGGTSWCGSTSRGMFP